MSDTAQKTEQNSQSTSERTDPSTHTEVLPVVQDDRVVPVKRLIIIGAIFALISIATYIPIYTQTTAWQVLAFISGLSIGTVCLIPVFILTQREKIDTAGYWCLAALFIAYGVGELVWSDATITQAISFSLLVILVGIVFRPRRWLIWFTVFILYFIFTLLIYLYTPLPRFPILSIAPLTQFINIPLALIVLWQIIRLIRIGSIRTSLLIASIATVSLSAAAITAGSVWIGIRNGQQQAIDRLELVATLKENEFETWMDSIYDDLFIILTDRDFLINSRTLIEHDTSNLILQSSVRSHLRNSLQYFKELIIINAEGQVILSTERSSITLEGNDYSNETFFLDGLKETNFEIEADFPQPGEITAVASIPISNPRGDRIGVLLGRTNMDSINAIMSEYAGLGATGEAYLVNTDHLMLSISRFQHEGHIPGETVIDTSGIAEVLDTFSNHQGIYESYRGRNSIAVYHWMPRLKSVLVIEQDRSEAISQVNRAITLNSITALFAVLLAAGASLLIAQSIGNPISDLAHTATQIAAGDIAQTPHIIRRDEIGTLALAFNSMTDQLQSLISDLENRVARRTQELEERSNYLAASAEVGRAASSILNVDELITEVVNIIRDEFNLYYVGIFVIDEIDEWAILAAGTGDAGRRMLRNNHKLRIGGDSMIGQCIDKGEAVIALDIGEEAVHFENPYLPQTRSEGALPLKSRGQTLGAITVQSDQPAAFNEDIIIVLQTMADQVALAIDNANLFAETRDALEATRRAYGDISRTAWDNVLETQPNVGYLSNELGTHSANELWLPEMEQAWSEKRTVLASSSNTNKNLAVPIMVRGEVIGILNTNKRVDAGRWGEEDIALIEALANQLGQALESARLYEDTQRRAQQEQVLSQISTRFSRSLDMETVLQTAVQELGQLLRLDEISVFVGSPESTTVDEPPQE